METATAATAIVIAKYTENVGWVRQMAPPGCEVFVYDKSGGQNGAGDGDLGDLDGASVTVIPVPNAGREAETFARAICDLYPRLLSSDFERVAFLQGNPFDHCRPDLVQSALAGAPVATDGAGNVWLGCKVSCDGAGNPHHSGLPVHATDADVFETAPSAWEFAPGAQYVVPVSNILARPLEWWQGLRDRVAQAPHQSAPYNAWVMERLWPRIFDPASPARCI